MLAADTPHRLLTICLGTLLAARAGLLGTRRCTTHHELLRALRELAPQAQVVGNRVFVMDGPLASSADITAGVDLSLHLIADECGEAQAVGRIATRGGAPISRWSLTSSPCESAGLERVYSARQLSAR